MELHFIVIVIIIVVGIVIIIIIVIIKGLMSTHIIQSSLFCMFFIAICRTVILKKQNGLIVV